MNKRIKRRVLVNGDIVKTRQQPKYVFCFIDTERKEVHYLLNGTIHTRYIGHNTKIIISRYSKKEINYQIEFQQQFSKQGTLWNLMGPIRYKNFVNVVGSDVEIKTVDSVDEWREYFDNEILDKNFVKRKLRYILTNRP